MIQTRSEPRHGSVKLVALASLIGTTIEWYDFLVYGFLAPLAFNTLFFPSLSPLAGTIAAFGVFAVGFAARPLGGVFFAHYGDRVGRKPIMVSTLILMGTSTTLMGLTPTFAQIGVTAPLVLVGLRFLQGFSLGGESAAGPLLAMESAPGNTRGFFAALVSSGAAAGTVLGALAVFAVGVLPREQLLSWGWRLPFLLSAPIFAISFYVRMKVEESPIFRRAVQRAAPERVPVLAVLTRCKIATLQVLLCAMAESSTFYFTSVFGLSYGIQTLKLSNGLLLSGVAIGNAVGIVTNPVFGALSDRIGRRKPVIVGGAALLFASLAWILFGPASLLPPYVLGLTAGLGSGAAMLPYTVIKEANPPEMSGTATGVVNFLNFTFSALLGPVFGWILHAVSGGGSSMTLEHYQTAFEPLLYGVALAIVLTLLLKETGRAAKPPALASIPATP